LLSSSLPAFARLAISFMLKPPHYQFYVQK